MSEEEEDRTFNDEQRAIFEQPEDAPVKTRPRTPGGRDTPEPNADDTGNQEGGGSWS